MADSRLQALSRLARIKPGEDWITALLKLAAESLGARTAYLSSLDKGTKGQAQLIAWDAGAPGEPLDYLLKDTPCEEVLARGELFLDSGLCARFPADVWLAERGECAFMGRRLQTLDGETLGVLGVLNPDELRASDPDLRALFDVFASMTEMQLERVALLERVDGVPRALDPRLRDPQGSRTGATTIIVFDADQRVRQVLSRALIADGHEPVMVDSPDQLLRISKQFTPGVALVDTQFPCGDLDRLISCLREASPEVRVLLLAGDAKLSASQVAALGADSVLRKPFKPDELHEAIEALIDPAKATS
ncbi:MAG: hypothetical protein DHS20C15_07830 [Planctomycetota bacterium]|nr:MAG: hypothetical protein DHS20C15_07830 [Planctomycetota bacterium]